MRGHRDENDFVEMRIGYDYQAFTVRPHGGVSRLFVKLAEELAQLGEEPRVFAEFHWNAYLRELPAGLVAGRHLSRKGIGRVWRAIDLWAGRQRMGRWGAELVHETYYRGSPTGPRGVPVVVSVFDMIHEIFPESFSRTDPTSWLKRQAVERADHVICISEHTREDLIRLFDVPREKTSVTHLACESFADPAPIPVDLPRPYLLYVGQRSGYKNFARLLEAFAGSACLRDSFDLVVFGGGPLGAEELGRVEAHGLAGRVRQLGGDDRLLGRLYAGAAAFVYPSCYEGFGLPPLEAMAHGCAVVASNASCMPEVIGPAAEYFPPDDAQEMARAIERVVGDARRRAELVVLGRERLERYSWRRTAEETLRIYQRMLGGGGPAR